MLPAHRHADLLARRMRVGREQRGRARRSARACRSRTAARPRRRTPRCSGLSPPAEMPSIVTTARPSTAPTSIRQELTGTPSSMHGAGAAGALAAAELGPGQAEVVAQHAREAPRGIDIELVAVAVDVEVDLHRAECMARACASQATRGGDLSDDDRGRAGALRASRSCARRWPQSATSPTTASRRRCLWRSRWARRCCSRGRPASARPSWRRRSRRRRTRA